MTRRLARSIWHPRTIVALLTFVTFVPSVVSVPDPPLRAALLAPAQATDTRLTALAGDGFNAIVLPLHEAAVAEAKAAVDRIRRARLDPYGWIDVGRNASLAASHPEWMASLQTHDEWRRFFPDFAQPTADEVVKNYPWVPVLYAETFPVHHERVERLLRDVPGVKGVFLDHLQGAPSACGCGNAFCRWTPDYGPIRTATQLGPDAAARFVAAVQRLVPGIIVVPVWTTECAAHDKAVACGGVNCFQGLCWREYTRQLMPVAEQAESIAVWLPLQDFPPPESRSGPDGEWQSHALRSFSEILPRHGGKEISSRRLISVLQGWEVTPQQLEAQIQWSQAAGVGGWVVTFERLDQSWEPRLVPKGAAPPPRQGAKLPSDHSLPRHKSTFPSGPAGSNASPNRN